MHTHCMLDYAEHLARGHADLRPCVACRSAWPGGNGPPHSAVLTRGVSISGQGERWAAVWSALQFAPLFQRGVPGPGPANYETTGVCSTFEFMVHAHRRSPTSLFLLCSLFCDALSLPRGAYLDFPRPREWKASAGNYHVLFGAHAIQPQEVSFSDFRMEDFASDLTSKNIWRALTLNVRNA